MQCIHPLWLVFQVAVDTSGPGRHTWWPGTLGWHRCNTHQTYTEVSSLVTHTKVRPTLYEMNAPVRYIKTVAQPGERCVCVCVPLCEDKAVVHHDRNLLHGIQLCELWGPVLSCTHKTRAIMGQRANPKFTAVISLTVLIFNNTLVAKT